MASTSMQRRTPGTFGLFPLLTRDIDLLQENMRRLFSNNPVSGREGAGMPQPLAWVPAVEISETPEELTISAEIPGINADEVHVTLDGDVLTIRGEKKAERREEDDDAQYYLVERSYGGFQRSFTLPSTVDPDSVRAEFNNGVLNIHLKKQATGRPRGREIPIAAQSNGGGQRVTSSSRTEGQPRGNQGSNRGEAQTTQSTPNRETTGRSSRT